MAIERKDIQQPDGGLDRAWAVQSQPPFTLSDALNVRCRDVFERRARLGSRPGLLKAFAQNVSIQATVQSITRDFAVAKDTHIGGDISPLDVNYGNETSLFVGRLSAVQLPGYAPERTLLHFDMDVIPANATLTVATLQLRRAYNQNAPAARIYRISDGAGGAARAWGETTVTWSKYNGVTNWTTAGGDFELSTPAPIDWAISADTFTMINVLTHAQDAYANRGKQLHMLLKLVNDLTSNTEYGHYFSNNHATQSVRPKLTVTYEVAA